MEREIDKNRRRGGDRTNDEIDKQCIAEARDDSRAAMNEGVTETNCIAGRDWARCESFTHPEGPVPDYGDARSPKSPSRRRA